MWWMVQDALGVTCRLAAEAWTFLRWLLIESKLPLMRCFPVKGELCGWTIGRIVSSHVGQISQSRLIGVWGGWQVNAFKKVGLRRSCMHPCIHSMHLYTVETLLLKQSHTKKGLVTTLYCTCTEVSVCGITGGETIQSSSVKCVFYPGLSLGCLSPPPKPPLAPASVDLDIVDYFQPLGYCFRL